MYFLSRSSPRIRPVNMRCLFSLLLVSLLCVAPAAAQSAAGQVPSSALHQIAEAFEQGNVPEAEAMARAALEKAPHDPAALSLLGVILDAQKRYGEAEIAYEKALAAAPGSPGILNNFGNHYLAQGKTDQARAAFLKVVSAEPRHPNANLQLAQLALGAKQGSAALRYLDRLPPDERSSVPVAILRARALELTGQDKAAQSLLGEVETQAGKDPSVSFSIGMAFAEWQRYTEAESAFSRALDADPTNFEVLYNLGLAAQHAGHTARALEVYGVALQQRPDDVDCLFNVATIEMQTGHSDEAVRPLMQAHKAAPDRVDVLLALGQASEEIGFYGDAATALDQYLKFKPGDDIARRERGFCLIRSNSLDRGLQDLRWYAQKHPRDARGYYELAIGETVREQDQALQHLTQALALDSGFSAARFARAVLYYEKDRTQDSVADLKILLSKDADNFRALDLLGQDYVRLQRYPEAVEVLDHAVKLAPKDPTVLTHYAHVLTRSGKKEEAEKVLADYRALASSQSPRPNNGLFDYLSLTPDQQYAKYLENLQRDIGIRPNDPSLRIQLGKASLQQGKPDQAVEAFRAATKLSSDPAMMAECGKALLDEGEYSRSREFLEPAVRANPGDAEWRLDLATAVFNSSGAEAGLAVLDQMPPEKRQGDYFLLRAEMLDSMNKPDEAAQALNRGLNAAPTRVDLVMEGAVFLIKHQRYHPALHFLEQATHTHPNAPQLLLMLAMAYDITQQNEDAMKLLAQIESRWPEWSLPYEIHGISLEARVRSTEAQPLLETAIALGANDANVYYYLASAALNAHPEDLGVPQQAIQKALEINSKDAFIQSLAGKIHYKKKEYPAALENLNAAVKLWPDMIEAHETLAAVYRATGEKEKSVAELKDILRIKQENPTADQIPPLPTDLLFTVHPPGQ